MSEWPTKIYITDVGPRDGLQNEPEPIHTKVKIALIDALSQTGLEQIETSAFVHPRWTPQLSDADEVFAGIHRNSKVKYTAVVPNDHGWKRALAADVDEIAVLTAASETFCQRNTNTTIEGTLKRIEPIVEQANSCGVNVRGYISCVIKCPYEGATDLGIVRDLISQMLDFGISDIALGDTMGVAKKSDIQNLYKAIDGTLPPNSSILHLHNTAGTALECAAEAMQCGVVRFDTSCGGLGGCPYAPGAAGNLATEDLVDFAHEKGIQTGIDLDLLIKASNIIECELQRPLKSVVYRASQD
ncbi:MAG: hydroxymethylglutaryl-CoA lyase [Planctomycetota bacterium]|nr:hydroxymethylglutaryl-CoA lyase [Planctomycetota bacterium]